MRKALELVKNFGKDENGAALIEYTVLLAIILLAVIVLITAVGGQLVTKWTALSSNL